MAKKIIIGKKWNDGTSYPTPKPDWITGKGSKSKALKKVKEGTKLHKGKGREGTMEHKATGLRNTRALFDR